MLTWIMNFETILLKRNQVNITHMSHIDKEDKKGENFREKHTSLYTGMLVLTPWSRDKYAHRSQGGDQGGFSEIFAWYFRRGGSGRDRLNMTQYLNITLFN